MSPRKSITRRQLLVTTGSIALLSVAGCTDDGGPGGEDVEEDPPEDDELEEFAEEEDVDDEDDLEDDDEDDELEDETNLTVAVVDEGELTVEGATVRIENGDEQEGETDVEGLVHFEDIEHGEYTIEAETDAGSAEETVELEEGEEEAIELEVPVTDEEVGAEDGDGEGDENSETDDDSDEDE